MLVKGLDGIFLICKLTQVVMDLPTTFAIELTEIGRCPWQVKGGRIKSRTRDRKCNLCPYDH